MSNTLDIHMNSEGQIVATVRSDAERDISAVIDDPQATILTLAVVSGLQVTVTGGATNVRKGEVAAGGDDEVVEGEVVGGDAVD